MFVEGPPDSENPRDVVQAALEYTKDVFVKDAISQIGGFRSPYTDTMTQEQLLDTRSAGNCDEGCAIALYNLLNKVDLFQRMGVIMASASSSNDFHNAGYYTHMYFVVQDTSGRWYGASPANAQVQKDAFETVLEGETLDDLLQQVTLRDGGEWPNAKKIESDFPSRSFAKFSNNHLICPLFGVINGETQKDTMNKYLQAYSV